MKLHGLKNLAVAVSFFYNIDKLQFLEKALSNLHLFADTVSVYIFTNLRSKISDENIKKCQSKYSNIKYTILYPKLLWHPYLLTWSHQEIFKHLALRNREITHYLYIEDDIQLNVENIEYYIEGENNLLKHKFIPSFVRYEILDGVMYSIDIMKNKYSSAYLMLKIQTVIFILICHILIKECIYCLKDICMNISLVKHIIKITIHFGQFEKWQLLQYHFIISQKVLNQEIL